MRCRRWTSGWGPAIPFRVVMGGLRTGQQAQPTDAAARALGSRTDDATIARTRQDFAEALRYGATGFPTLLFRDGDDLGLVIRGFVPWDELEPALTDWLEDRYGDLGAGLVCDPQTGSC